MKFRFCWFAVVAALLSPLPGFAQFEGAPAGGRLSVGGTAGWFRISHNDFDDYYSSRSGFSWGAHASYRVTAPYNLVVKFHRFDKDGDFDAGGRTLRLQWREQWINVGLRYMGVDRESISNFFSFGFSYFSIRENGGASIFSGVTGDSGEHKTTASGFFIDFGLHYPLSPRLAVIFDFEITSAGVEGKSGFEGSSVGGFLFGAGLSGFLF